MVFPDTYALVVDKVDKQTNDVIVVDLIAQELQPLPVWAPGAHIDIHLPSGKIRQYSLSGDPADRHRYQIGILCDEHGRGGSIEAHAYLTPGAEIRVSEPRNLFPLRDSDAYLFVAGGIGITPLLPMIREVSARALPWRLIYGGRSIESLAFLDQIDAISGGEVILVPQDTKGLIDLDAVVFEATPATTVYSCGPAAMLNALEDKFNTADKRGRLFIERFCAADENVQASASRGSPFRVELVSSGLWLEVPADKSLKEVLLNAGVEVPFSCEEGYCGSCETVVLRGTPEHHCSVLSPEERVEGKYMMVCVGRCNGTELALDL